MTESPSSDESFLCVLDGLFEPEAEGFRAEIMAGRGDAGFGAHVAYVKRAWPGLSAWMEAVSKGATRIVWARTQG